MVTRDLLIPRLLVAILMQDRTHRVEEGVHSLKPVGRTCHQLDLPDDERLQVLIAHGRDDLGVDVLGRGLHARRQPVDTGQHPFQ